MEHAVSLLVEQKLIELLGRPATCPHGNPIPFDHRVIAPKGVPLDSVRQGARVEVSRISEEANYSPELMRFLQKHDVLPGKVFKVKEMAFHLGTVTLVNQLEEISLGMKAAESIWVTPLDDRSKS